MTNIELQTLSAVKSAALGIARETDNSNLEGLAIKAALAVLPEAFRDNVNPKFCVQKALEVGLEFAKQVKTIEI